MFSTCYSETSQTDFRPGSRYHLVHGTFLIPDTTILKRTCFGIYRAHWYRSSSPMIPWAEGGQLVGRSWSLLPRPNADHKHGIEAPWLHPASQRSELRCLAEPSPHGLLRCQPGCRANCCPRRGLSYSSQIPLCP